VNHESLELDVSVISFVDMLARHSTDDADDAWIAPNATVTGDTEIGAQSSIWFGCIVRGDVSPIRIGARVNIQDGTIIHVSSKESAR
jgi:carbonic anhydrase/acetyltransferase-like protein (isoleucine patch superfamily)